MILKIDLELLNQWESFRNLDRLMFVIETGKHELIVSTDDIDILFESNWFDSLGERIQDLTHELFQKAAVNSKYLSKSELQQRGVFHISHENDAPHSLVNSLKILEDPCYLIIEDIESDKLFLKTLLEVYKNAGKNIKKALDKNWLEFSHSGGKTRMPKIIEDHFNRKDQPFKPRLMVILDSDKKNHEASLPQDTQVIVKLCLANDITYHVYEKREIENYIPEAVLVKLIPHHLIEITQSFCGMNPRQKDFYDLEKGFNNHRPVLTDPLYADLATDGKYNNLRYGFQHADFNAKKEIFKFVIDKDFNQTTLASRCQHQDNPDELKILLKNIDNLL